MLIKRPLLSAAALTFFGALPASAALVSSWDDIDVSSGNAEYELSTDIQATDKKIIGSGTSITLNGASSHFMTGADSLTGTTATVSPFEIQAGGTLTFKDMTVKYITESPDSQITWHWGSIYVAKNGTLNVSGSSSFINNFGAEGGSGGVFYTEGQVNIYDTAYFTNNTSGNNGGVIGAKETSVINIHGNAYFNDNATRTFGSVGGAISTYGTLNIYGNAEFNRNTATGGGAFALSNATTGVFNVPGSVVFNQNSAIMGGAMYMMQGEFNVPETGHVIFTGNTATGTGGAIYGAGIPTINITGSASFIGNSVTGTSTEILPMGGGAIFTFKGTLNFSPTLGNSIVFANNTAAFGSDIAMIDWDNIAPELKNKILLNGAGTVSFGGTVEGAITNEYMSTLIPSNVGTIEKGGTGTVTFGGKVLADSYTAKAHSGITQIADKMDLNSFEMNSGTTLTSLVHAGGNGYVTAKTVTLNGAPTLSILVKDISVASGTTFNIVTAKEGNSINGSFAPSIAENGLYSFEFVDNGNALGSDGLVTVKVVSAQKPSDLLKPEIPNSGAGTKGEVQASDAYFDTPFPAGSAGAAVSDVLNTVAQQSPEAYKGAVSALMPDQTISTSKTIYTDNIHLLNIVNSRMNALATGRSGGSEEQKYGLWTQGFYSSADQETKPSSYGFQSDTRGITMGIDAKVSENVTAGVGYTYTTSDIDSVGRKIDLKTHTALLYGQYKPSRWSVDGIVSYGFSNAKENKDVAGMAILDKYDVNIFSAQVMTGYDISYFTPSVGMRYMNVSQDGRKDSADQYIASSSQDILTGIAELKYSRKFRLQNKMSMTPKAGLGVTYDFVSDDSGAVVGLMNGSGYTVMGTRLHRLALTGNAEVKVSLTNKIDVSVGYNGEFRKDFQNHTGMVKLRFEF